MSYFWTEEQNLLLYSYRGQFSLAELALLLGKSKQAVSTAAPRRGIAIKTLREKYLCEVAEKPCTGCAEIKPLSDFPTASFLPTGTEAKCLTCRSTAPKDPNKVFEWRLRSKYNISAMQYQALIESQDYLCALCLEPETKVSHRSGVVQRLSIDHDHRCCDKRGSCGACIRGLLCDTCNNIIRHVDQKSALAIRFSDYLSSRPFRDPGKITR